MAEPRTPIPSSAGQNAFARQAWEQATLTFAHGNLFHCQPDWQILPQTIAWHCVFLVVKGTGWVTLEDQRQQIHPGHLVLPQLGETLAAGHDPHDPLSVYSVGYLLRNPDGIDPLRVTPWPVTMELGSLEFRTLQEQLAQFVEVYRCRTLESDLQARGLFLIILARVMAHIHALPSGQVKPRKPQSSMPSARLAAVQTHVDAHLDDPLSSATLAKLAHVTPSHLATLFRRELGLAPSAYVRQRRLSAARSLLATSDLPVSEIAQRVGFPDPYHFSRVFAKGMGLSPSQYRKSCKHPF